MQFISKDGQVISIEMKDPAGGKRPGLYIGNEYCIRKVACFSNEDDAMLFAEKLKRFFGIEVDPE